MCGNDLSPVGGAFVAMPVETTVPPAQAPATTNAKTRSRTSLIVGVAALVLLLGLGLAVSGVLMMRNSQVSSKSVAQSADSDAGISSDSGAAPQNGVIEVVNAVKVPDLRNMTPSEVQKALKDVGLMGKEGSEVYDPTISVGHVSQQSPGAGTEAYRDDIVTYQLSKGTETVAVPDVVGRDQASATSLLQGAGFSVDVSYAESSSYAAGVVMSQSITGSVSPGSTVGITVSTGAPKPAEPKNFPSVWAGSYEGSTSEADIVVRPFTFRFDHVGSDGSLSGVCELIDNDSKVSQVCSYRIAGHVDWTTDEFYVEGTSWINKGDLVAMSMFEGKVDYDSMTMVGLVWSKDENPERSWSARPA